MKMVPVNRVVGIREQIPCKICGAIDRMPNFLGKKKGEDWGRIGKCIPCNYAKGVDWREKNPEKAKAQSRRHEHKRKGWAPGENERAEAALPHVKWCACCGSTDPGTKSGWHADHAKLSGKFRAHICHSCNVIISFIEKGRQRADDHPVQEVYLHAHTMIEERV